MTTATNFPGAPKCAEPGSPTKGLATGSTSTDADPRHFQDAVSTTTEQTIFHACPLVEARKAERFVFEEL